MRIRDNYPIIVTGRKDEARDFWQRFLGFRPVFDSSWFTLMTDEGSGSSIAFMTPDHPSAPPGPDAFAASSWRSTTQQRLMPSSRAEDSR